MHCRKSMTSWVKRFWIRLRLYLINTESRTSPCIKWQNGRDRARHLVPPLPQQEQDLLYADGSQDRSVYGGAGGLPSEREGEPVAHRSRTVMTKVILHFNEDLEWLRVMLTSDRLEDTKNIMCENPPFTFCGFRSSACWSVRRSREY